MQKPANWDTVEAICGGGKRLTPGGHVCKIVSAAEQTSRTGAKARLLASCEYFTTYHITVDGKSALFCGDDSFQSFTVLDGSLVIKDEADHKVELTKGETVFLPAGLGRYKLKGQAEIILSKL